MVTRAHGSCRSTRSFCLKVPTCRTPTIGDPYEPNLEALAAQDPDLIIGDEFLGEELYKKLSIIAPTVAVTYINNGGWRERFPKLADALGKADLVADIDAEYPALDGVEGLGDETLAFVRSDNSDGAFRIDSLPAGFAGSVAQDAGLTTLQPVGIGEGRRLGIHHIER